MSKEHLDLSKETIQRVSERSLLNNKSEVIETDLKRYNNLMDLAKSELEKFKESELLLLANCLQSIALLETRTQIIKEGIISAVKDAVKLDNADVLYGVKDIEGLMEKLQNLSSLQAVALLDAISCFFESTQNKTSEWEEFFNLE